MNTLPVTFPRIVMPTRLSNSDWLVKFQVVSVSIVVDTKLKCVGIGKVFTQARTGIQYVSCDDPIHSQK